MVAFCWVIASMSPIALDISARPEDCWLVAASWLNQLARMLGEPNLAHFARPASARWLQVTATPAKMRVARGCTAGLLWFSRAKPERALFAP